MNVKKIYQSAEDLLHLEAALLREHLPQDREGDLLYSLISFIRSHARQPSENRIFNDVLFHINSGNEILNPLRVFVTDKEHCKQYVKSVLGDEVNVPTLAVLHNEVELADFRFPERCVIKPTHASGEVMILQAGGGLDMPRLKSWFALNYYHMTREANYRYLQPKIIVEPILFDNPKLSDIKIFCLNGKAKLIFVDIHLDGRHLRKFYDIDWNPLNFALRYPNPPQLVVRRPLNFTAMLEAAERLSRQFSFVRIDLYSDSRRFYVGEITNCSGAGLAKFDSYENELRASDIIFGSASAVRTGLVPL